MKFYVSVYSLTLLLSAILVFTVQPMFSKMILPLLGGTSQVWTTAMLFFQLCLLAGYAYAHGSSKLLSIRIQAFLHLILLSVFLFALPFGIPDGWSPPEAENPTFWQLSLMTMTIGGPFFVVSASAPMLQRWFAASNHKDADNPYFLYGASNLGSMSALLSYPFIIEPMLTLNGQADMWKQGYLVLIAMIALCLILIWKNGNKNKEEKSDVDTRYKDEIITTSRRIKWILLSFTPSSLMLGVTTFITTDIASAPLLWILPLALYIGTFIIVFARKPVFKTESINFASALSMIFLIAQMIIIKEMYFSPLLFILFHLIVFFSIALACHTELANSRPTAKHLTEFYLIMSLGGALGGIFNAVIAPTFFIVPVEYAIALGLAAFLRFANDETKSFKNVKAIFDKAPKESLTSDKALCFYFGILFSILGMLLPADNVATNLCAMLSAALLIYLVRTRWAFAGVVTLALLLSPISLPLEILVKAELIHQDRNFFGIIKVINSGEERLLLHGTTNHGTQPLPEEYRLKRISYYSETSPLTDAMTMLDQQDGPQKVAVIGLGVGVMSCYTKEGREFDLYEIDKDIAEIAENQDLFTYLSGCGSPYKIILGDGRLKIDERENEYYDAILIDAFSSDNIPIHLLTKEAIEIYLSKLKPNGMIVLHISNNFIDLEPVLALVAKELDVSAIARLADAFDIEGLNVKSYPAHYFTMSKDPSKIDYLKNSGWTDAKQREGLRLWTDQYSNLISVLNNRTLQIRFKEAAQKTKGNKEKLDKSSEEN